MTCDKDLLVGYLYDELTGPDGQQFERHLSTCRACREEVESLRETRTQLALWRPPEPDLGFEIVQRPPAAARSRFGITPAWGLAAAAVLVLASASAIANLEIRAGDDGLVIRTGWGRAAEPATQTTALSDAPAAQPADTSRAELQAILQRVVDLETQLSSQRPSGSPVAAASDAPSRLSDAELLRRVRDMLEDSEKRQQTVLATRVVQAIRELEAAYRTDLVRLQQGITQNQGMRDAEVIRQRDMLNQVYRLVAQQR